MTFYMRARLASVAVIGLGLASVGATCNPSGGGGQPDVDLEFFHQSDQSTIWSAVYDTGLAYNLAFDVYSPGFPALWQTPLGSGVGVKFRTNYATSSLTVPTTFTFRFGGQIIRGTINVPLGLHDLHEAQIYLLDPWTKTFVNIHQSGVGLLPWDYNAWLTYNTTPPSDAVTVPDAVVIPYPAENSAGNGFLTHDPLTTADFIGGTGALSTDPEAGVAYVTNANGDFSFDPTGSVKAVRIIDSGMCSYEMPYHTSNNTDGLLDLIRDRLSSSLLTTTCTSNSTGSFNFLNLASWITNTQPGGPDIGSPNLSGGFFLRTITDVKGTAPLLDECEVAALEQYQFGLQYGPKNGILSVSATTQTFEPAQRGLLCNGGCDGSQPVPSIAKLERTAFEQTLPLQIYANAYSKQAVSITIPSGLPNGGKTISCVAGTRFHCQTDSDCPPDGAFDQYCDTADLQVLQSGATYGVCKTKDPCGFGTAVLPSGHTIVQLAENSGRFVIEQAVTAGAHVLGMTGSQIARLVAAVDQQDGRGVFEHFDCTDDSSTGSGDYQNLTCKYITPAKRLNTHPDGVELVFFDDDNEFDNSAFASFVAEFAVNNTAYQGLCGRRYPTVNAQNFFTRRFATDNLPAEDCGNIPPPVPNCQSDANCTNGQICLGGFCGYPLCTVNPSTGGLVCPPGLVCQTDVRHYNQCMPPCQSDTDCGMGDNGSCQNGSCSQACQVDADCDWTSVGGTCSYNGSDFDGLGYCSNFSTVSGSGGGLPICTGSSPAPAARHPTRHTGRAHMR